MDIWTRFVAAGGEQCVISPGMDMDLYRSITDAQGSVISSILGPLGGDTKTILDFGCGPGRFLEMLAGMFGSVTGYDPCPTMLTFGPVADRIKRRCHIPPGEFDVVLCWGVLGDPDVPLDEAAHEIVAHLVSGGTLLLAEHCAEVAKKYRWQFRESEFYLDLFARHGMTLSAVNEIDQHGHSVTIFTGQKN